MQVKVEKEREPFIMFGQSLQLRRYDQNLSPQIVVTIITLS
jgi:hypothetical protein